MDAVEQTAGTYASASTRVSRSASSEERTPMARVQHGSLCVSSRRPTARATDRLRRLKLGAWRLDGLMRTMRRRCALEHPDCNRCADVYARSTRKGKSSCVHGMASNSPQLESET
jgi:hypothetical protein